MAPPFSIHLLGGASTTADAFDLFGGASVTADALHLLRDASVTADALRSLPVVFDRSGTAVVGEGVLDRAVGEEVRRRLADGEVVVVLAQPDSAAAYYPVPVTLQALASPPRFIVDRGVLPSLGAGDLAVAGVVVGFGPGRFPDRAVVGATGATVVGSHPVGPGRLVFCQFEVCALASAGDEVGRAVLADLLRWALVPRPTLVVEESCHADGRRVARYSRILTVAR